MRFLPKSKLLRACLLIVVIAALFMGGLYVAFLREIGAARGGWQPPDVEKMRREGKVLDAAIPAGAMTLFMRRLECNLLADGRASSEAAPVKKEVAELFSSPFARWSTFPRGVGGTRMNPGGTEENVDDDDLGAESGKNNGSPGPPGEEEDTPAFQLSLALSGLWGLNATYAGKSSRLPATAAPGERKGAEAGKGERGERIKSPPCSYSGQSEGSLGRGNDPLAPVKGWFNVARYRGESAWVERDIAEMKDRVLMGVSPVSGRIWKQRGLHTNKGFEEMEEILAVVIEAVRLVVGDGDDDGPGERMKMVFKDGRQVVRGFGEELENMEDSNLLMEVWEEFYFSYLEYVVNKAHKWILSTLDAAMELKIEELLREHKEWPAVMGGGDPDNLDGLSALTEKLVAIHVTRMAVDYQLLVAREVFRKYAGDEVRGFPANAVDWRKYRPELPLDGLRDVIGLPMDGETRKKVVSQRWQVLATGLLGKSGLPETAVNSSEGYVEVMRVMEMAGQRLREEVRATMVQGKEDVWVSVLRERMGMGVFGCGEPAVGEGNDNNSPEPSPSSPSSSSRQFDTWGFVGYRLDYSHSKADWEIFEQRFEDATISHCGEDSNIPSGLRGACRVRWIDGRDVGLEEANDVEGAKNHYDSLITDESRKMYIPSNVFLVADGDSIASFLRDGGKGADDNYDEKKKDEQQRDGLDGSSGYVVVVSKRFDDSAATINATATSLPVPHPHPLPAGGEQQQQQQQQQHVPTMRTIQIHGPPITPRHHSQGYSGSVKMVSETLFHDLFPGLLVHGDPQYLREFWANALLHPNEVYVGPLGRTRSKNMLAELSAERRGLYRYQGSSGGIEGEGDGHSDGWDGGVPDEETMMFRRAFTGTVRKGRAGNGPLDEILSVAAAEASGRERGHGEL
ncbi:hypothetical protein MKZ38_001686 [Zalerion maritima]|uniref:Uncharacterized protein n=1 Tax=Zalerion maritima TaxID=339359 RepID=A0AAD5RRI8_9PEZI|nr:hypothetical protein MKZ38_001686 [Zalerion maritima]